MTALPLPALDGRTPLGFLAALGVLRLITDHTSHPATLAWSRTTGTAELHDAQTDIDQLVADLTAIMRSVPEEGVLPRVQSNFPPRPRGAKDGLRLPREDFPAFVNEVTSQDPHIERWIASLVTDLVLDREGRIGISRFAAPTGRQTMRTMFTKSLEEVRRNPSVLREAIESWRRHPGVTGENLDAGAALRAADTADGEPANRGIPGATWLALMSFPLLRTTMDSGQTSTSCWQQIGNRQCRMIYPLWHEPLNAPAVEVLLTHPILRAATPGRPPLSAARLSIFTIVHASRRKGPGDKTDGVLTPTSTIARSANGRRLQR